MSAVSGVSRASDRCVSCAVRACEVESLCRRCVCQRVAVLSESPRRVDLDEAARLLDLLDAVDEQRCTFELGGGVCCRAAGHEHDGRPHAHERRHPLTAATVVTLDWTDVERVCEFPDGPYVELDGS